MAIDRTKVSFAEAESRPRFPSVLKWGEVDQHLRAALWAFFYSFLNRSIKVDTIANSYILKKPIDTLHFDEYTQRRSRYIDEYEFYRFKSEYFISDWEDIIKKQDYVELFDFITFVIRQPHPSIRNAICRRQNASPSRVGRPEPR